MMESDTHSVHTSLLRSYTFIAMLACNGAPLCVTCSPKNGPRRSTARSCIGVKVVIATYHLISPLIVNNTASTLTWSRLYLISPLSKKHS